MAASDHLNPNQLRLFMQAKELMDLTSGHTEGINQDYLPYSQSPGVYRQKLAESKVRPKIGQGSLHESIQESGVKVPVRIRTHEGKEQINDGHHRIAAANDIDPEMYLPVEYDS